MPRNAERRGKKDGGRFGNNIRARGIRHAAAQHVIRRVAAGVVYHGIWSCASVPEYTSDGSKIELA